MVRSHDYQIYAYCRAMDDLGKRRGENLFRTTQIGRFLLNALIVYMEDPRINDIDNERVRDGVCSFTDWELNNPLSASKLRIMTASEKYELHKEEYIKNLQTWMDMEDE